MLTLKQIRYNFTTCAPKHGPNGPNGALVSKPTPSTLYEAKTMSLEQSIDELNATVKALAAAVEAATGVLVALGGASGKPAGTPPAASTPAPRAPGRPKAAAPAPTPAPAPAPAEDEGLGGDDDTGLGDDDGGLGGDDSAGGVTGEQAKAAVLAYRDKAIKVKGKEEGMTLTRQLMKKHVAALDDIDDSNASAVHTAFTTALGKLK